MNFKEAYQKLEECGQLHVLDYYDELTLQEQEALLEQIDTVDFKVLKYCKNNTTNQKGRIAPLTAMQLAQINAKREYYTAIGLEEIKKGKVAAVLLAGGMGARLGSDNPKGMFDIGITRPVYIFQRIMENLLEVVEAAGAWVHLFVMTSDKNHDVTIRYIEEKKYFG